MALLSGHAECQVLPGTETYSLAPERGTLSISAGPCHGNAKYRQ